MSMFCCHRHVGWGLPHRSYSIMLTHAVKPSNRLELNNSGLVQETKLPAPWDSEALSLRGQLATGHWLLATGNWFYYQHLTGQERLWSKKKKVGCDISHHFDYLCIRNGQYFYVETTCVTMKVATKKTGLTDMLQHKACCYRLLTKKIFAEVCNKTPQCSNLGAPCLIAICT